MKRTTRSGLALFLFAILPVMPDARADDPDTVTTNEAAVIRRIGAARAKHAGNTDVLVREGLIADRAAATVTVFAEATGLGR